MSHLASEIDSSAIRRVNCTRLLVVARWARAARRAYLSIKWQCTLLRERGSSYVHGKTFRSAPWDNLRRSLPSASPVTFLSLSLSSTRDCSRIRSDLRPRTDVAIRTVRSFLRCVHAPEYASRNAVPAARLTTSSPRRVYSRRKQMAKVSYHSHLGTYNFAEKMHFRGYEKLSLSEDRENRIVSMFGRIKTLWYNNRGVISPLTITLLLLL